MPDRFSATETVRADLLAVGDEIWDVRVGEWVILSDVAAGWERTDEATLDLAHRVTLTVAGRPGYPARAEQKLIRRSLGGDA